VASGNTVYSSGTLGALLSVQNVQKLAQKTPKQHINPLAPEFPFKF